MTGEIRVNLLAGQSTYINYTPGKRTTIMDLQFTASGQGVVQIYDGAGGNADMIYLGPGINETFRFALTYRMPLRVTITAVGPNVSIRGIWKQS